ncbi:MAG TPA: succinate dehydrogenase iron-sulfur subunit [Spirochaetia bacterium]|nr:succinate dehydrogenase iron-sulfur subunit [Spirochaetia bacterium]
MKIILRITRSEGDGVSRDADYALEVDPTASILDALLRVKDEQDGTLSFRRSCGHGVCGSDAMRIAGVERLACKTLVRDVAAAENAVVTVAPLAHLPVQRDLMVDQERFFERYRSVSPFLVARAPAGPAETEQTPKERAAFDDATSCILCASCWSACPVLDQDAAYLGPAALVSAARFVFDSRDAGLPPRRAVLDDPHGAWGCENHFTCTRVCPREIKVTKNINALKRALKP